MGFLANVSSMIDTRYGGASSVLIRDGSGQHGILDGPECGGRPCRHADLHIDMLTFGCAPRCQHRAAPKRCVGVAPQLRQSRVVLASPRPVATRFVERTEALQRGAQLERVERRSAERTHLVIPGID